ncbi:MAG: copper resistance protein CopC [Gemmatimonadetes bacterium]|nr:copper resistance protein CopC [Gemmatimonadota bacterium]
MVGGDYTIAWRTASADGHVIRGTIPFSVRPE